MSVLLPLLLLIPLWLLLIRPQQRRIRAQQAMVQTLEVGDDILTSSGIYGTIVALDGEVATIEVAEGINLRIARMAIGRRFDQPVDPATSPDDDADEAEDAEDATHWEQLDEPDATSRPPTVDEQ